MPSASAGSSQGVGSVTKCLPPGLKAFLSLALLTCFIMYRKDPLYRVRVELAAARVALMLPAPQEHVPNPNRGTSCNDCALVFASVASCVFSCAASRRA